MTRPTILVVDDNADFRMMVRLALERAGYAVMEADDGLRALAVLEHATPNLVLLDVNLPRMNGVQFVDALEKRGVQRPFGLIAMSGAIDARSSPAKWFLSKPIDVALLLQVVGEFCGRGAVAPLWVCEQQRESIDALRVSLNPA